MDISEHHLSDMMLDLSLATGPPLNYSGRNTTKTLAAVNAIGVVTQTMPLKELRKLEYSVGPLVVLLRDSDLEDAVVAKAAFALKSLMTSRLCLKEFLRLEGVKSISNIYECLLSEDMQLNLKTPSHYALVVEHLCSLYKAVAVHYPWDIVRVGGIRHCIAMLRRGSPAIQASAVGACGSMCDDIQIAKQMFRNGATKPIIAVSDADVTNEPCMIAGLGCIAQLAKVHEIGIKISRQGVVRLLEKGLHRDKGVPAHLIREKAITCISWLSRIPQVKHVIATPRMLSGLQKQFFNGTHLAKVACAQVLRFLQGHYPKPEAVKLMREIREPMLGTLTQGKWTHKDQMMKAFCVVYREDEERWFFVQNGILEIIFKIMTDKPDDLAEAPIVLLLNLCTHPDVPPIVMDKGGLPIFCEILNVAMAPVIIDLVTVLLKVCSLYDRDRVDACLDEHVMVEKAHLKNMDSPDCTLFGSEYGNLACEYCQEIVHHRWDQRYLLEQFSMNELDQLKVTDEMLEAYQKTFMLLDVSCRGFLELDALRVIIVMKGEVLDDEQLYEIFAEYDTEGTGRMNFRQFVDLLSTWKNRFGLGPKALANQFLNTGTIGRAKRAFMKWWNKNKIAREQVAKIKAKNASEKIRTQLLGQKFLKAEDIKSKREQELALRASGKSLSQSNKNINRDLLNDVDDMPRSPRVDSPSPSTKLHTFKENSFVKRGSHADIDTSKLRLGGVLKDVTNENRKGSLTISSNALALVPLLSRKIPAGEKGLKQLNTKKKVAFEVPVPDIGPETL